jgi:hypothetical protein
MKNFVIPLLKNVKNEYVCYITKKEPCIFIGFGLAKNMEKVLEKNKEIQVFKRRIYRFTK